MEKRSTIEEQATGDVISTMANKVLAIGDNESNVPDDGKQSDTSFKEQFRRRLIKLMLTGTQPLPILNRTTLIDRFSARKIGKNGKSIYQFDCTIKGNEPGYVLITGPCYNSKLVLNMVKNRLKDEIWITNSVVECRTKGTKEYYHIQALVSECLDQANYDFYNYVLCLQQQFRYDNEIIQK